MGIFSKKNTEGTESSDLAKKVEEYNRKFLASQEQPKAEAAQPVNSTAKPLVEPRQGNFDKDGFRVVSEENMNYANGHIHRFIESIANEKVKATLLIGFEGDRPSPTILRAASQFFNLTFNKVWNSDSYALDDLKYDMDKLCDFINAQDDLIMCSFIMGYSKYVVQEIITNLRNADCTEEEITYATADIAKARDTIFSITEKKMPKTK